MRSGTDLVLLVTIAELPHSEAEGELLAPVEPLPHVSADLRQLSFSLLTTFSALI
jgi:hypothetical protein